MPSNNYFLSIREFNEYFDLDYVNCLFTSFIRSYNIQYHMELEYHCDALDDTKEIGESYLCKADELRTYNGYGREAFKRINSIEEADSANEFRLVFGHELRIFPHANPELVTAIMDYHVVIGVRDSTGKVRWYHKVGYTNSLPHEVTPEDWVDIYDTYPSNPPALFAFYEPQR